MIYSQLLIFVRWGAPYTKEEWLLFLDNADDPLLDLKPYIMWPHGNVLITTRNREVHVHAPDCNIRVDKLELDDAVELLLRGATVEKSSETKEIAYEIVQTLGCLALAVNQARGFLAQDICNLSEYLPIYMQNRKKILEDKLIQSTDDYEHTVYTTWTISFNKLSSPAARLLELLCFMHHEGIPSCIFEDAWKICKKKDGAVIPTSLLTFLFNFETVDSTWDLLRFRMLVKEILSFSLVEFNTNIRTFSLNQLVQQWAQSQCRHPREVIRSTQTLLSLAAPSGESKDDFVMTLSLLPHLQASAHTGIDVHFTLLPCLGLIYEQGGMFQECGAVYEQMRSNSQKELGLKHINTLRSMDNVARTYGHLGQHRDALKLREKILALSSQIQGEKHPDTLGSMNNLAVAYSDLGQHRSALEMKEQVLALSIQIQGEEHPKTLTSMSNLAVSYSDLGQHKDALKLEQQVLALRAQVQGEEHPDTLTSMDNLASTYSDLGQHNDALKMKEQVLALRKNILGDEHPSTLIIMNNLAITYSDLGHHKDALKLKEQVLTLRTRVLGEKHPLTIISMHNLAFTHSHLGQHKDAMKLEEQALALKRQLLGEEHPDTLCTLNNLASTYSNLSQHKDALKLMEQVLALRTRILGKEHPETLESMTNLAFTYSYLGQHKDALDLHEQTLGMRMRVLGLEHPDTIVSLQSIGYLHNGMTIGTDGENSC
ncbi:hypothetical protein DL96DRAFT_1757058 [Flagelloscypha sp. PMI_526]|nr:hypothetical protein DL96DRAFT_1757058 [Flagelloscypha sp. PMI_526]